MATFENDHCELLHEIQSLNSQSVKIDSEIQKLQELIEKLQIKEKSSKTSKEKNYLFMSTTQSFHNLQAISTAFLSKHKKFRIFLDLCHIEKRNNKILSKLRNTSDLSLCSYETSSFSEEKKAILSKISEKKSELSSIN